MSKITYYDAEELLLPVGFTKADLATIKKGHVVNTGLQSLTERDLATLIGLEAKVSVDSFEDMFLESPEKQASDSTIQQIQVANHDGELDFTSLKLLPKEASADMVKTYLSFKGGSELNLSQKEIDAFHALDKRHASAEQVEQVLQKVLQGRLDEYKQSGLEGVSPYLRAKGVNFYPGKELLEKAEKSPNAHRAAKEFTEYVLSWPTGEKPAGVSETFGWINYLINDKPSIAMFHKIIYSDKERGVKCMMNRTFYVSMGHNSVQQFGLAAPTGPDSTLFMIASRTSTDQVAGFGGAAKRGVGSRIMGGKIAENMERVRDLTLKHQK
jgi:hypothetical protein